MSNPNNTTSIEELIKEFEEIGFGNQARIPGGKYGAKRVELKDFIKKSYSQGVTDTIKRVEEEVIGKEITIDDVANLDLPKIYTNEAEARKDLWEEAKRLNSLREHLLTKLSSMKEKGMSI